MRKTKNISKYDLDWQIVRASVKGSKMDVYAKLDRVIDFYNTHTSKENWERVVNWLEGLALGYKKQTTLYTLNAFHSVNELLKVFKKIDIDKLESIESINDFSKYTFEQRYVLWKDLLIRTKNWAKNGYIHQEQLDFCNALWNSFTYEEEAKISSYYAKETFDIIISSVKGKANKYRFLF